MTAPHEDCAALKLRVAALEAAAEAVLEPLCIALAGDNTTATREAVAEGYRTLRDCMADDATTSLRGMMEQSVEAGRSEAEYDLGRGFEVHNSSNAEVVERILKGGGR